MMNILWRFAMYACGFIAGLALWEFIIGNAINDLEFCFCMTIVSGCSCISSFYINKTKKRTDDKE